MPFPLGAIVMELLHSEPAAIWRLLIPASHWLYADDVPNNELVFTYRDQLYFVNDDGSILSVPKPRQLDQMDLGEVYDYLSLSDEAYDFDDAGEFDYALVLQRMGYLIPSGEPTDRDDYLIELVNTTQAEQAPIRYQLQQVSFVFALYHGLMRCHELNVASDGEDEHEIKRISKLEPYQLNDLQMRH